MTTITLEMPEPIFYRLNQMARVTRQPLERVIFQSIQGNLPPLIENLPLEWSSELTQMQFFSDNQLWAIAKDKLPVRQWQQHQALLERQQVADLTPTEQAELANLRQLTDHFVFRRSYALALLKWRGYTLEPTQLL